jgi:1,4-alpha-glucan branching enzyme
MTHTPEPTAPDGTGLIAADPWLRPFADALRRRFQRYQAARQRILAAAPSLVEFANAHHEFGFNRGRRDGEPGVWFREWAPAAIAMSLVGDFNKWDRYAHPLFREAHGVSARFFPDRELADRLTHGSRVKVHVHSALGPRDRIPACVRRAVYDPTTHDFAGQYWQPPTPYVWRVEQRLSANAPSPCPLPGREGGTSAETRAPTLTPSLSLQGRGGSLRIYEAHIGMATEEERVGTYREFTQHVLPRIARAGYNAVQLMAIQEHPYYGSFGYQVSNFYAPSSRFGTPEDLKELIDTAHALDLRVLLDLVHSHAVKNVNEGLSHFDGTEYQYFHAGGRGQHPAWDSLCFDYAKLEVQRFLLSNVRYWLEEFRFDGFRFDGVTSMLYLDHGLGRHFTGYGEYFPPHVDEDAITYLQLANELVHTLRPDAITIAEDVSGMVGLARPLDEGGLGFDYRLAMGIPDYWIKLLKEQPDEAWHMGELFHVLTNRRAGEKHVAYAESHDQALVGDKTIAMWLIDADIYWHMTKEVTNLKVDRGIALHKMIRLLTFALGGEAYLNFMGNEFGHPEWIDFPRAGNHWSYKYARRQWSLADDPALRYHALRAFDRAMLNLDLEFDLLGRPFAFKLHEHEDRKLLSFYRGPLVFVFNFHAHHSYPDLRVGIPAGGDQRLVLTTDDPPFGGHGAVHAGQVHPWQAVPWDHQLQSVQVYVPARAAVVLAPAGDGG